MFLRIPVHDFLLTIIMRQHTKDRLANTCFRGTQVTCAGNFRLWHSANELFDSWILKELADYVSEHISEYPGTHRITIDYKRYVGWSSTAPRADYQCDDLESFEPNRKSTALRLKLTATHLKAPQTSLIMIIFELKFEHGQPVAVVHSLYPGADIGELCGDISEREKVIFFDWNHPGQ
jgi:hypothetical protein